MGGIPPISFLLIIIYKQAIKGDYMEKIKVIFLDVDGVLNPKINMQIQRDKGQPTDSYSIKIPGDKIYRLKKLVKNTNAILIMSSSWRLGFRYSTMEPSPAYQNINNQLMKYNMQLSGWTPLHKDRNRGIEITWWLMNFTKTHGYKPKYVILDDKIDDMIPIHTGHIVQTTSLLGLQDEHVIIATNILNH